MIKKIAFIGHPVRDLERAKKFYGEILGLEMTMSHEDKWCEFDTPEGKSIGLDTFSPEGTPPYMALETDDIEAEVSRLEVLGAQVKQRIRNHVVMRAPGGHTFCVVPVARSDFDTNAAIWP